MGELEHEGLELLKSLLKSALCVCGGGSNGGMEGMKAVAPAIRSINRVSKTRTQAA